MTPQTALRHPPSMVFKWYLHAHTHVTHGYAPMQIQVYFMLYGHMLTNTVHPCA